MTVATLGRSPSTLASRSIMLATMSTWYGGRPWASAAALKPPTLSTTPASVRVWPIWALLSPLLTVMVTGWPGVTFRWRSAVSRSACVTAPPTATSSSTMTRTPRRRRRLRCRRSTRLTGLGPPAAARRARSAGRRWRRPGRRPRGGRGGASPRRPAPARPRPWTGARRRAGGPARAGARRARPATRGRPWRPGPRGRRGSPAGRRPRWWRPARRRGRRGPWRPRPGSGVAGSSAGSRPCRSGRRRRPPGGGCRRRRRGRGRSSHGALAPPRSSLRGANLEAPGPPHETERVGPGDPERLVQAARVAGGQLPLGQVGAEQGDHGRLALRLRPEHDHPGAGTGPVADRGGDPAQVVGAGLRHPLDDQPAAVRADPSCGQLGGQPLQPGDPEALQLPGRLGERLQPAPELLRRVLGTGVEQRGDLAEELALAVGVAQRLQPREGLDAAQVGPDGGLAEDDHGPDLAAVADVGAAAQLAREVADVDHPNSLAVLLAEQADGPRRLRLGQAGVPDLHVRVGQELAVDRGLDLGEPLGRHGREVGEVEAEPAGVHQRALLPGVLAELVAQRPVEGVGGGVAAGDGLPAGGVDLGVGLLAR